MSHMQEEVKAVCGLHEINDDNLAFLHSTYGWEYCTPTMVTRLTDHPMLELLTSMVSVYTGHSLPFPFQTTQRTS